MVSHTQIFEARSLPMRVRPDVGQQIICGHCGQLLKGRMVWDTIYCKGN